jgi:hypothetical protein
MSVKFPQLAISKERDLSALLEKGEISHFCMYIVAIYNKPEQHEWRRL